MKHIIRSVKPHGHPFIFQGELDSSAGVVDPSTVRVFQVWENFGGIEIIGPAIFSKKSSKKMNDIAVRLTREYRAHTGQDKN
tara:strand:+ start:1202 stop:1447 length:246 start_codon:yes stop_codon:yes gene_type:complete